MAKKEKSRETPVRRYKKPSMECHGSLRDVSERVTGSIKDLDNDRFRDTYQ